jgi:hypothetical protein
MVNAKKRYHVNKTIALTVNTKNHQGTNDPNGEAFRQNNALMKVKTRIMYDHKRYTPHQQ